MKILFLSFYYQPDLSAGSFRSTSLIKALLEQLPSEAEIELITTHPNRYNSFTSEAPEFETHPGLTIHRIKLPKHKSGIFDQSKAFLMFAIRALHLSKGKNYDLIYATSSRLMTSVLGAYISKKIKKPLYLDIRDIFVDSIKDVLPRKFVWAVMPFLSALERWTITAANRVNLVSQGFMPYFLLRYPNQNFVLFTNGIDDQFINIQPQQSVKSNSKLLTVVYAGNMGDGQGLHTIIPELAKKFKDRLQFNLVGDGSQKKQLVSAVKTAGCNNVKILSPVKRDALINMYQRADILFLHLSDYNVCRKVLPSKLFEYAALGKPIWAGVTGYAAQFIYDNINNVAVFLPCNAEEAIASFERLEIKDMPRTNFVAKFSRKKIMKNMAKDIINTLQQN